MANQLANMKKMGCKIDSVEVSPAREITAEDSISEDKNGVLESFADKNFVSIAFSTFAVIIWLALVFLVFSVAANKEF